MDDWIHSKLQPAMFKPCDLGNQSILKGFCMNFGKLICFERHLGFQRTLYQILINALMRVA